MAKLNIAVDDAIHGVAGQFGPDTDGDFAVEGRKFAWKDQTVCHKVINLTEVEVGDDLSGATINFNPNNLPMFLNPNAGLSGFQWVVWSGTSGVGINIGVAWNANSIQNGALEYIYNVPSGDLTVPNWLMDTYTFPENTIVTEMYDLGGNRQNWDDVVAGCDPSGWNPSMATVRMRVAPVDTVDEVPAENSENLITSGGVWGETHYRMSSGEGAKTLAEASVGEDMSGVTLDFTSAVAGTLANTPEITFANGSRLGLSTDNQTWALWGSDSSRISPELFVAGSAREVNYTIPDGHVVSAISDNNADSQFSQSIGYNSTAPAKVVTLGSHVENDKGYWATLQEIKALSYSNSLLIAQNGRRITALEQGAALPPPAAELDMNAGIVIHTPALIGALGFEIGGINLTSELLGGWDCPSNGALIFSDASVIGLLNPEYISVNGVKAAPTGSTAIVELLGSGEGGQIWVNEGDKITSNGVGTITFYPVIVPTN